MPIAEHGPRNAGPRDHVGIEALGKLAGWEADGCEVLGLPGRDNGLSIDAVLEELGRRRMTNLLVEGGASVRAFLDAKTADEVHVYIALKIIGGTRALSPVDGAGIDRLRRETKPA